VVVGLVAALGAAAAFGVAALLQALAARREEPVRGVDPRLLVRMLRSPAFVVALVLNLLGFALHVVALRSLPLFLTQAAISSSVVVTALLSGRVLRAALARREHLAVVGVGMGLVLLTATAAHTGQEQAGVAARWALLGAAAAVTLAGAAVARLQSRLGVSLLGLTGGLGFAVVALATRMLPDLSPATLVADPATYALLVGGGVGFLLYATALQRAAVMVATSTLVVGQTVAPALVGVLLLGDEVRAGAAPLAVGGLVLAVAGSAALARYDPHLLGAERPAA
jgi:drug/metabolite transporter (DMT)-like permease